MKKIILSLALFFSLSSAFSQSFMQGAGVSLFGIAPSGTGFFFNESLTYSPRFNFFEADNLSVSVGVPLSLGLSFGAHNGVDSSTGFYESYTKTYSGFFVNIPAYINVNFGRGSTKTNTDKIGYFVGAGFGYYAAVYGVSDTYNGADDNESAHSTGVTFDAGMRFGVGRTRGRKHIKNPKNVEARLSYMSGSDDLMKSAYGLACSFNF